MQYLKSSILLLICKGLVRQVNAVRFTSLADAQVLHEAWRERYSHTQTSHSATAHLKESIETGASGCQSCIALDQKREKTKQRGTHVRRYSFKGEARRPRHTHLAPQI